MEEEFNIRPELESPIEEKICRNTYRYAPPCQG